MVPTNSAEVRRAFLDFFTEMGHQEVSSSPLPIYDNPTLLFTNAGMNQFVDTFLGKEERPYRRAASAQKCMRVQGKHNDLENVGPSPRHHTFFEMLGNFSFGDYFKQGAIRYAYEFLTTVCQISEERLWYTVHEEDDDAYSIWVNDIGVSSDRVLKMGDATNFWMMGDTGPCGPTSEVHYDWGPEYCSCGEEECSVLLDNDCERWLEIWNLVFMQFNQHDDGSRTPLPKPGVDTGMGLERITAVVEQQPINYDTDLFAPAMDRIQEMLKHSDSERQYHQTGYRVIADHGRAATFLIADGVLPGNAGGGYVLRMIIRRAARFGRTIGFVGSFLREVAQVYIQNMSDVYPELKTHKAHILHTLDLEEARFAKTLDAALAYLEALLDRLEEEGASDVPGREVFNLYATHGLPLEITRDLAGERGFEVDEIGYQEARNLHAQASGAGAFGRYETADNIYAELLSELIQLGLLTHEGVDYDPYGGYELQSSVVGLIIEGQAVEKVEKGQSVEVITAATPFYIEAGGEVSDTGTIRSLSGKGTVRVTEMARPLQGIVSHLGVVEEGKVAVGDIVVLEVDNRRRWDIRRNHTATHLLHRELRVALGDHVTQQGSLVAPDRLRFDFSYGEAVDKATLRKIEEEINAAILANFPVEVEFMPLTESKRRGAMALFGEKYGDIVRTIRIGQNGSPYSFELCGGLHVNRTGDIGYFRFVGEEAVGAGLRRVEAVTGRGAQQLIADRLDSLELVANKLRTPVSDVDVKVEGVISENRALHKEVSRLRKLQARTRFKELLNEMQTIDGVPLMSGAVSDANMDDLREMTDWFRDSVGSGVSVLGSVMDGKPIFVVAVTDDLVKQGVKAGAIVGKLAKIVGGGGGGRPNLAQAGGKDATKLDQAIAAAAGVLRTEIGS